MKGLAKILTKEFLIEQYSTKSTHIIAKEIGCSTTQVGKYLKKFNIPRRNFSGSQSNAGRPKGIKDTYIRKKDGLKYILTPEQYKEYRQAISKKNYLKNKEKNIKNAAIYKKNHPWIIHYSSARQRCTNPKSQNYPYYGGRGIKFLMTVADFKFLWFRDQAWLLKRPSIDRKDPDGNYELSNCQFIELADNKKKQRFHNQFSANQVTDCSRQT